MSAVTVALTIPALLEAREAREQARRVVDQGELADLLFQAVRHLGFERGRVNVVLGDAGPVEGMEANRAFIQAHRAEGEAALQAALTRLHQRIDRPGMARALAQLDVVRVGLEALRLEVDRDARLPKAERLPALTGRWFQATTALIDAIADLLAQVTFGGRDADATTIRLAIVKLKSIALRNSAGPEISILSATMLSGEPLPSAQLATIQARRAETEIHWRDLTRLCAGLEDPALARALSALRTKYLVQLVPLRDRTLAEAIRGGPYSTPQPELLAAGVAALEAISGLMDAALRASQAHVERQHAAASWAMGRTLALLAGALVVMAVTIHQVKTHVTDPLARLTAALRSLAGGDLSTPVPALASRDELAELAESIATFKETARQRVQEGAARLDAEARLRSAQRLAATGVLARGLAHEINSPLAGVMSNLAYVREQLAAAGAGAPREPSEVLQALDDAADCGGRIRDLVVDLRTFAVDAPAAGEPARSLAQALLDARRVASRELARCRSVQVEVPEVSDLNLCYPDLVQLLALLLLNAGQATGPGPNDVMVVAAAGAEDVTLTVSDTGVGMDEPTRARALEPFFTTRGVGQGRGLGLSVCHGIVTGAGGEIDLRSGVGSGTTVTVRLPRLVQSGAPAGA